MISHRFIELTQQMRDIHEKKNAGYSGVDNPDSWANFRLCEQFGVSASLGCMVRLSDKYKRACNLLKNPLNEQVGEALEDTLLDLANYSLIMVCLLEEKKPTKSSLDGAGGTTENFKA